MNALGIDTSNYTTSAALYGQGKVVENRKLPLPVRSGARGPYPRSATGFGDGKTHRKAQDFI